MYGPPTEYWQGLRDFWKVIWNRILAALRESACSGNYRVPQSFAGD